VIGHPWTSWKGCSVVFGGSSSRGAPQPAPSGRKATTSAENRRGLVASVSERRPWSVRCPKSSPLTTRGGHDGRQHRSRRPLGDTQQGPRTTVAMDFGRLSPGLGPDLGICSGPPGQQPVSGSCGTTSSGVRFGAVVLVDTRRLARRLRPRSTSSTDRRLPYIVGDQPVRGGAAPPGERCPGRPLTIRPVGPGGHLRRHATASRRSRS